MAQTVNKPLAAFISQRFSEMMKKTDLDIESFAAYSKIGYSTFRTYHSQTVPISVETLKKICDAFDILLCDFFNSDKQVVINDVVKNQTFLFAIHYLAQKAELLQEKHVDFSEKPIGTGSKWQREMIKYIILHTDYFHTPRSIAEMLVDFAKKFDLILESGRLYELLRKYVDNTLKKEKSIRINNDSTTSKRTIYLYKKV